MDADEQVTEGDLRRAVDVREGLRALLLGEQRLSPSTRAAVERLDRAASRAGLRLRFHPGGCAEFEPDATGVDGAMARLLAIVAEARVEGDWQRLKACAEHTCRVGLLRQVEEPLEEVVPHGDLRERGQGARLPRRGTKQRQPAPRALLDRWTLNRLVPPLRPAGSPAVMPICRPAAARPASTAASAQLLDQVERVARAPRAGRRARPTGARSGAPRSRSGDSASTGARGR